MSRVPGGAKGTRLKLWGTSSTWYAESFGCTREVRNMLSVSCACLMSLHHRTDGKSLAYVQSPAMVWFLKVWMARSAALERWLCGSTSCIFMPSSSRYVLTVFVATLSMMLNTSLKFRFFSYSIFVLNASTVVSFLNFLLVWQGWRWRTNRRSVQNKNRI